MRNQIELYACRNAFCSQCDIRKWVSLEVKDGIVHRPGLFCESCNSVMACFGKRCEACRGTGYKQKRDPSYNGEGCPVCSGGPTRKGKGLIPRNDLRE